MTPKELAAYTKAATADLRAEVLRLRRELEGLEKRHKTLEGLHEKTKLKLKASSDVLEKARGARATAQGDVRDLSEKLRVAETSRLKAEHMLAESVERLARKYAEEEEGLRADISVLRTENEHLRKTIESQKQHMMDPDGVQVGGEWTGEVGDIAVLDPFAVELLVEMSCTPDPSTLFIVRGRGSAARVVWAAPETSE